MSTDPAAIHAVAERLGALMHQFRVCLRTVSVDTEDLAGFLAHVLTVIASGKALTARDIVLSSGRDKAQVARVLKDLQRRGLIGRHPHQGDRRVVGLSVTPAGEELAGTLIAHRRRVETAMTQSLSPQEQATIITLMDKMLAGLDAFLDRGSAGDGAKMDP